MKLLFCLLLLAASVFSASPPGDVVGKVIVGYQGWFSAAEDGSPGLDGQKAWWHWSDNWRFPPSLTNKPSWMECWPDMRNYPKQYKTDYPNYPDGTPANLFSSFDEETLRHHLQDMVYAGIDALALQRFNPMGSEGPIRDAITAKLVPLAEQIGPKFYIMYDVTSWTNFRTEIKTDWLNKMSKLTSSPAYAHQNGKPVVSIWGFGFNDPGRPFTQEECIDVINWFKNEQGVYLIGGVPTWWRTNTGDSRPGFNPDVYAKFNMLSPWMVGRVGSLEGADQMYRDAMEGDQQFCDQNGIDYQPCILPGNATAGHRHHGDLMWRMFYNAKRLGVQSVYISMFDEYQEGNQIARTAENKDQIPAGSSFTTLDEDGTRCTSDYYLRLTNDGGKMFRGESAHTETRPTIPWP